LEEPGTPATGTIAAPPGSGISPLDPGSPPVAAPQSVSQPAPERRFLLDFLL
jgi:hypothetical protein